MKNMSINTEYKVSKQLSIRYRESAGTRLLAWPDEEVCQARATSKHHRLYVRIRYWPAHVIGLACFHNFQCLQEHIKLKIFLHALLQHSGMKLSRKYHALFPGLHTMLQQKQSVLYVYIKYQAIKCNKRRRSMRLLLA
jgi:hypothetical protein